MMVIINCSKEKFEIREQNQEIREAREIFAKSRWQNVLKKLYKYEQAITKNYRFYIEKV